MTSQKPQVKATDRRYQRRKNIPRRKPANYPQNSASPNSGVLCLCKEKRSVFGKPRLQRLPKRSSVSQKNGKLSPEFGFAEFWSFVPLQRKTQFLRQTKVAKAAKAKTGKLSQKAQLFAVLAQGVCTRDGFFDAKTKLCAQEKALCLCTALEKAPCTQPFRKKGQGLPKNKEKLQTVPFLPVQGRLIVLLFIVFLHYHTAVMAPKP